jgi:hypothetical protein
VANYATLPAIGTRGGVILAVSDAFFSISDVESTAHTLSAVITMLSDGFNWFITVIYGPQGDQEKIAFIQEMQLLGPTMRK